MTPSRRGRIGSLWPFLGWTGCGLGFAVALLTPFTIGPIAALISAALAVALLASGRARGAAPAGLIAGCGILALAIAYLNRGGPGNVCTTTVRESSCVSEWSPWPWLGVGIALLAAAVTLLLWSSHANRDS